MTYHWIVTERSRINILIFGRTGVRRRHRFSRIGYSHGIPVKDRWFNDSGDSDEKETKLTDYFNLRRIPYRVVIFDIFSFLSFVNSSKKRIFRMKEMFGYFRNDFTRKTFLLFRSFNQEFTIYKNCFPSINHFGCGKNDITNMLYPLSTSINSLKSLSFDYVDEKNLGSMISNFPNLQSLHIRESLNLLTPLKEMETPQFSRNLRKIDISLKTILLLSYNKKTNLEFPSDLEHLTLRLKTNLSGLGYLKRTTAILLCVLNNPMFTEMKCIRALKSLNIKFIEAMSFVNEEVELHPHSNRSFHILRFFNNLRELKISAETNLLRKYIVITSEDLCDLYALESIRKLYFNNITMDNSQSMGPLTDRTKSRPDLDLYFENFPVPKQHLGDREKKIKKYDLSKLLLLPNQLRSLNFSFSKSSFFHSILNEPKLTLILRKVPFVETLKLSQMKIHVYLFRSLPKSVKYLYLDNVQLINDPKYNWCGLESNNNMRVDSKKSRSVLWDYEYIVFNKVKIHLDVWKMYFEDRLFFPDVKYRHPHHKEYLKIFKRRNVKLKNKRNGDDNKTISFRHVMIFRENLKDGMIVPTEEFTLMKRENTSKEKNKKIRNQKFSKKMKFGRKPRRQKKKYSKHFSRGF